MFWAKPGEFLARGMFHDAQDTALAEPLKAVYSALKYEGCGFAQILIDRTLLRDDGAL